MIIYYENANKLDSLEVQCQVSEIKNKLTSQIVAGVNGLDLSKMLTNQQLNHLQHIIECDPKMFVRASDLSLHTEDSDLIAISEIKIINDLNCLKAGEVIIAISLKREV